MDPRCTIIIGHSYGGLFVHDLADDHGEKIKQAENAGDVVAPYAAIFAISPVGLKGEITGLNPDCVPGLPGFRDIDADNVRRGTEKITVIVGSDDKIVNPQDSRDLAKYCKADECITVQGYGHFREGEGCVTFPLLFKLVEKTIEDLLTSIVSQV
jgi:pimeloyl-ACP methyl ester carboxylesterase